MLLTTAEVAKILRVHPNTVYAWRRDNKGPKAFQLGRTLRFRREDVESWIAEQGGADGATAADGGEQ